MNLILVPAQTVNCTVESGGTVPVVVGELAGYSYVTEPPVVVIVTFFRGLSVNDVVTVCVPCVAVTVYVPSIPFSW